MPISHETRPHLHPKPWRRGAQFTPPRIRRLGAAALRAWTACVCRARADGLISPGRLDVAQALVKLAGWNGRERIALAVLASCARVSIDTAHRALDDLEHLGLVRRHAIISRGRDGRVAQEPSVFELLAPPAPEPQGAAERVTSVSFLSFLRWKAATGWARSAARAARKLLRGAEGRPSDGNDEWGRANAARQMAALAGAAGAAECDKW